HQGKTYYFCAVACKNTFERDPQKYLGGHAGGHSYH
ncbi:MAG: YHS domain-containing protein, partial [Anaerolineae bacterium]